jgi:hypothetical protein
MAIEFTLGTATRKQTVLYLVQLKLPSHLFHLPIQSLFLSFKFIVDASSPLIPLFLFPLGPLSLFTVLCTLQCSFLFVSVAYLLLLLALWGRTFSRCRRLNTNTKQKTSKWFFVFSPSLFVFTHLFTLIPLSSDHERES